MRSTERKDSDLFSVSSLVIPDSLRYTQPKHGPEGQRREIRISPVSSSYTTASDKIVRVHFNSDSLVDFRRGYISFDLTLTTIGPFTYRRISQGIWSIFNRLRLTCGPELDDIREYNLYNSLLFESLRDEDIADVIGPSCYGFATQAERNSYATTTKSYAMPLLCGFFLTGVIPLGGLQQRLELLLYMEDPSRCVETDAAPGSTQITLTNFYVHAEQLKLSDSMSGEMSALVTSGIKYPYKRFTHYVQPVSTTRNNLVIPHIGSGIEALISVLRRSDTLANTLVNDKLLTYEPLTVEAHQVRINNELYPPEKTLTDTPQSYVQYLRYIGKWHLKGVYRNPPAISIDDYNNDKFIIVNQFETHPGEGLINPLSTEGSSTTMFITLDLTVAPTNIQIDTFVQSFGVITFTGGKLQ